MKLKRRLALLERGVTGQGPIVLNMADGSAVKLAGNCALGLLAGAVRDEQTPEVELVARSVSPTEPGGAHLVDLARAILNTPTEVGVHREASSGNPGER